MKKTSWAALTLLVACSAPAFAQTAASSSAPTGSTGACNDGSYTSAGTKRGACAGHKGVKDWYGTSASTTSSSMATPATSGSKESSSTMGSSGSMGNGSTSSDSMGKNKMSSTEGKSGQVWVNTSSMVYHCSGDRDYGHTKQGKYMSESDAKSQGAHAARGKSCA